MYLVLYAWMSLWAQVYFFCVFSLQVISTLQSSQVSVCLAWTQISLKTPFWSQVTQQAHFRFGTFLPLQWTSNLRCAGNKIAPGALHLISPYTWHIFLHTGNLWTTSTAAAILEGSQKGFDMCGSPWSVWQTVCPDSISWWFCWTMDRGRQSCGVFWARGDVEYRWPRNLS